MYSLSSVLSAIVLLTFVFLLALSYAKIEAILRRTLFKKMSRKNVNRISFGMTIFLELLLVTGVSFNRNLSFIDALFMGSFIILTFVWVLPSITHSSQISYRTQDKRFSGIDIAEDSKIFQTKFTPFVLASTLFSTVGILTGFISYYKYFL